MAEKYPTPRDEAFMPLIFVAVLLALDIAFTAVDALPVYTNLQPLDTVLKVLIMLILAIASYARPVEYGAQLIERGRPVTGIVWLAAILSAPFLALALAANPAPQLGLLATVICAIIANIITKVLAPDRIG